MKESPVITLTRDEVEVRGGHGVEAVRVDVENPEGLVGRFWVSVRIRNGRPVVTVTTKLKDDKQVVKSVTGAFNRI